jgi:hypothetical protein
MYLYLNIFKHFIRVYQQKYNLKSLWSFHESKKKRIFPYVCTFQTSIYVHLFLFQFYTKFILYMY